MPSGSGGPSAIASILAARLLEIVATPGHSPDSISLYDRDAGILLAADFLYPGDLYGAGAGRVLAGLSCQPPKRWTGCCPAMSLILGAHGEAEGRFA